MLGSVARNTSRPLFPLQCRSCSPTRHFNRPGSTLLHIWMRRTRERCRPARGQPCFDLSKVPNDTPGRKCKPSRKVATLLHLIDGAVGKRDHLAKLVPPDGALDGCCFPTCHLAVLQAIETNRYCATRIWGSTRQPAGPHHGGEHEACRHPSQGFYR